MSFPLPYCLGNFPAMVLVSKGDLQYSLHKNQAKSIQLDIRTQTLFHRLLLYFITRGTLVTLNQFATLITYEVRPGYLFWSVSCQLSCLQMLTYMYQGCHSISFQGNYISILRVSVDPSRYSKGWSIYTNSDHVMFFFLPLPMSSDPYLGSGSMLGDPYVHNWI